MSVSNLVCIVGVYSWVDYTHYTHIIPAHITAYEPAGN